ncbi:MAG: hypothetical protein ACO2OO_00335 [Candidatus Aenigmatarchaeota archaeon]
MALLGQTTMLEVVSALVLLFTTFYFIFKPVAFKDNWQAATLSKIGKDLLLSLDFIGKLYNASFSEEVLKDFLGRTSIANESLIISIYPERTIKEIIIVAANCTQDRIKEFSEWYGTIIFNRRFVNVFFVPSDLTKIPEYTDLLLICGYINLTNYKYNVLSYLSKGKGIVEISDFTVIDDATREIFGITTTSPQPTTDVYINKPLDFSSSIYYPYKFFYNIPILINATSINTTSGNYIGNFTFRNYTIPFEIDYNLKRVYFRTNSTISVSERNMFSLYGYDFFLSYILSNSSFAISFKKIYNFTDFRGNNNIKLTDGDEQRIFLYEGSSQSKVPVAVMNTSKVAWIADFDRNNNATHDQKLALLSLILTVSNKTPYFREPYSAYSLSYLNVENYDIYEVYKVTLRITYPSG